MTRQTFKSKDQSSELKWLDITNFNVFLKFDFWLFKRNICFRQILILNFRRFDRIFGVHHDGVRDDDDGHDRVPVDRDPKKDEAEDCREDELEGRREGFDDGVEVLKEEGGDDADHRVVEDDRNHEDLE